MVRVLMIKTVYRAGPCVQSDDGVLAKVASKRHEVERAQSRRWAAEEEVKTLRERLDCIKPPYQRQARLR